MRVFSKIDKWHNKESKKNVGAFEVDNDFNEIGFSPNKFDSSSEEELACDDEA